jgi:TrmH family RNA methyltransferase
MAAPEVVQSRANPLYKRLRALVERSAADGASCLLEGPKLVLEALGAGLRVVEAAAAPGAGRTTTGERAIEALAGRGVAVRRMSEDLLASLSEADTAQGLLAVAERPRFDVERIFDATPLVLVADGVQNPGNLGGLLRSAEAAGATGAMLTAGTADPFSWKALRGSMGSAFRLPHVRGHPIDRVLDLLEARGVRVVATAADGDGRYDEADLRGPVAIVVGAEGAGLPVAVRSRAAARVRIPLHPPVESLNVGVAAALLLFEAARQRGFEPSGGGRRSRPAAEAR